MGVEGDRLAAKEIDAPEAILHVADEGEPRGTIPRLWLIVFGENASHNFLIDVYAKRLRDNHGDAWAAKVWVSPFQFDDDVNKLLRGTFGSRF